MRTMGETTVPAKTYEIIVKVTCDLCGKESPDPDGGMSDTTSWNRNDFEVEEVTLHLKEGSRYPEGSTYDFVEADICRECFLTKLVPWLKEQGVTMRERTVDF